MCLSNADRHALEKTLARCKCGGVPVIIRVGLIAGGQVVAMCPTCQKSTPLVEMDAVVASWGEVLKKYSRKFRF